MDIHNTLERQLARIFGAPDQYPSECQALIDVVSKTYTDYDNDYKLVERSLDISSKELSESNIRLREENEAAHERAEKLESLNNMMIDREIKMVELKKEIKKLRAERDAKKNIKT